MTGVTHGADAARLREIAQGLRGQAQRVQEVGDLLEPYAGVLREAWSGSDAEQLVHDVSTMRPMVASIGATLVAWSDQLRGEADEQSAGSGEGGGGRPGAGGAVAGGRAGVEAGLEALKGLAGRMRAPESGQGREFPFGGGMTNAIGDGPQTDPGEKKAAGSVSYSRSAEAGAYKVTDNATVSVSGESVDAEGRSVQTTEITLDRKGAIELGKEMEGTGASVEGYTGAEVGYSVTAPVGVDPLSIDPLHPETWPEGVSVRFDESFYAGYGMESKFRGLIVGMGQETGTEHYVEISKGTGDQVVVQVGDERFTRASSEVGFGTDQANVKVGADNGVSSGTAHEMVIDQSTPEGQALLRDLFFGGEVPSAGDPGVVDIAELTVFGADASVGASGTVGDVSAGTTLAEWNAGGVQRTHADGTTTLEWSGLQSGTQVGGVATFDANGDMIDGKSTYYMRLEGVSPEAAAQYNELYLDDPGTPAHDNNVVLNFTSGDIAQMKTQAAQTQAAMINANPGYYHDFPGASDGNVTASDVLRHCENNPDAVIDLGGPNSATQVILTSGSDAEVLRAMMATGGPLEFQNELAVDYYSVKGERIDPVGEVTSQRSA